jgi:hypothetical protein
MALGSKSEQAESGNKNENMEKTEYRVFVSYSHKDLEEVKKIVKVLEQNGLKPMWDDNFACGYGFHEQIQTFINHAHVFMPVITRASSQRGWVHQEIGYAMALNIPVLPVTRDMIPGEMLQRIHAVRLGEDIEVTKEKLSWDVFDNLVNGFQETEKAFYRCAEQADDRTIMMIEHANNVLKLKSYGLVRQKGGLSSFHIPYKVTSDPVWKERYDTDKSIFHCRNQRKERLVLGKHAKASGCRLIINPVKASEKRSDKAQLVRLQTLLDFLKSELYKNVQIVINEELQFQENLTIVGDWFAAESVSGSITQGYRQTIFTCHAPSMQSRIELFDQEFEELLQKKGWTAETSRVRAIKDIEKIIEQLNNSL